MIRQSIQVKIRPGKKKEFLRALLGFRSAKGMIGNLVLDKGCLNYQLIKDKNHTDQFLIESEWKTIEDLELHFSSKNYSLLLGAINILCDSSQVKTTNH